MIFTLEALPAEEGDCLLLHWGTVAKPKIALIDGGPGRVYEDHLRPRLEEIGDEPRLDGCRWSWSWSATWTTTTSSASRSFPRLEARDREQPAADNRPFKVRAPVAQTFNDVLNDSVDGYYKTLTQVQASVDGKPNPEVVERSERRTSSKRGRRRGRVDAQTSPRPGRPRRRTHLRD